jgi:hypothetical protein
VVQGGTGLLLKGHQLPAAAQQRHFHQALPRQGQALHPHEAVAPAQPSEGALRQPVQPLPAAAGGLRGIWSPSHPSSCSTTTMTSNEAGVLLCGPTPLLLTTTLCFQAGDRYRLEFGQQPSIACQS